MAGSEQEDARCDCNRAIQNNEFASQVSQSSGESKEESEDVGGDMKGSAVIEKFFCCYWLIFFLFLIICIFHTLIVFPLLCIGT